MTASGSARSVRPAARLAWRMFRRDLRRNLRLQWLTVLLIAVPVVVGVYVAVAQRTVDDSRVSLAVRSFVGDADSIIAVTGGRYESWSPASAVAPSATPTASDATLANAELVAALVAAVEGRADDVLVVQTTNAPADPEAIGPVVAADWSRPLADSVFARVDGRLPGEPGEVAITARRADALALSIGDRLSGEGASAVVVVGVVHPIVEPWVDPLFVAEGWIGAPIDGGVGGVVDDRVDGGVEASWVIGIDGLDPSEVSGALAAAGLSELGAGEGEERPPVFWVADGDESSSRYTYGYIDPGAYPYQAGALITAGLLVETALLAAAAFVVRGRRREAEMGRLATVGAEPNQLSALLVTEALVVGAVGAVVGATVALVAAFIAPSTARAVGWWFGMGRLNGPVTVAPADVVVPMMVAVLAAGAAGWLPARRAGRVQPNEALAGAAIQPPLPRWWRWAAPAAVTVAVVAMALADALNADRQGGTTIAVLWVMALLSLLVAMLAVGARLVVALGDRVGRHRPTVRIAVRELVRHRTRSVVVLGSVAVICALAATMAVLIDSRRSVVIDDAQVALIDLSTPRPYGDSEAEILETAASAVEFDGWVGLSSVVAERPASFNATEVSVGPSISVEAGSGLVYVNLPTSVPGTFRGGSITVATPELVDLLGLDQAALDALARPDTMLLTGGSSDGEVAAVSALVWPARPDQDGGELTVVTIDRPDLDSLGVFGLLAPANLPSGFGADDSSGRLIASPDGFTAAERERLEGLVDVRWPTVVVDFDQNRDHQLVALAVVALLVLVVARVAAALLAIEADGDVRTMLSIGAPARSRRRLLAVQIGVLVALAVVVAVPTGLGLAAAVNWFDDAGLLTAVPLYLVVGLLLLPLTAAAVVAATTRSRSSVGLSMSGRSPVL